jgi:hypothetical protein
VFGGADRTTLVGNRITGNAANGIIFHGVFDTPSGPGRRRRTARP